MHIASVEARLNSIEPAPVQRRTVANASAKPT
jgi:hypothetical protein